jgi:hypothetical protein
LIINESDKSFSQQGGTGREAGGVGVSPLQKINNIGIVTIKTAKIKYLHQ